MDYRLWHHRGICFRFSVGVTLFLASIILYFGGNVSTHVNTIIGGGIGEK